MSKPTSITIELDFDKLAPYLEDVEGEPLGPGSVESLIVELAARRLLSNCVDMERSQYSEVYRRIASIRDETIAELVRPQIEEALERSFTRTNSFGEPTGETTTLREVIVEEAKRWLTKPGDGFSRRGETNVQHLINQEVDRALTSELKAAIQDARHEVTEAVKAKGAEVLTETIKRLAEDKP